MSSEKLFFLPDGRKTTELKVSELKKELEKLGKSKSGNKLELLNRLNESFSAKIVYKSQVEKESSVVPESQTELEDTQLNKSIPNMSGDDINLSGFREDFLNSEPKSTLENDVQITNFNKDNTVLNGEESTVQEVMVNNQTNVTFISNDLEKDLKNESLSDDLLKNEKDLELKKNSVTIKIDSEILENEIDYIENIELENQIEVYEVDNIDLDSGQIEIFNDTNKDDVIFSEIIEKKPDNGYHDNSITDENLTKSDECYNHVTVTNEISTMDDAEEGEVLTVPITARLGKRRIREDNKTHLDSKKPKKKGLKEIKGAGYIVEGPERIQPPQKSKHIISDVLRMDNLVRPFTLTQLQEMLETQGKVKDLWLNKIKSVAYVRYESQNVAIKARENIDGCRWPSINNKLLACDFVFIKEMEWMKENGDTDVKPPPSFKPQQQGWTKQEAENDWRSLDKRKIINREVQKTENQTKPSDDIKKQKKDYPENKYRNPSNPNNHRRKHDSPKERPREKIERVHEKSKEKVPPAVKLLEDIFRKTVTQPAIYWLPVPREKKDEVIKKDKENDRTL